MGRSGRVTLAVTLLFLAAALAGCGSKSLTNPVSFPVPASITLSPADRVSIDIGSATQSFTATARNSQNQTITTPITFHSTNTEVLTIATNGAACAGTWDSLANPQICTAGPVGVAQVTAEAQGVSSPPTTVYVHQHIDLITVAAAPGQTQPAGDCFSKDQVFNYQATALSRGVDITSTVGVFTWNLQTSVNSSAVQLSTTASGLLPGQVKATARTPGFSSFFASASGVNSLPVDFTTCAVQSITLTVTNTTATSKSMTATVVDTQGTTIAGVPLTWTSSEPATVTAAGGGSSTTVGSTGTATASSTTGGGATVIASCTPPTCNVGFLPSQPIYPQNVVTIVVPPRTGTTQSGTLYVTSKGCGTTDHCFSTVVPVTVPANTVGNPIFLPATPNSLVFSRDGARAYLGTDVGELGTKGLAVLNATASPPTVAQFTSVSGKVLAVSPDGKKVIVSHTDPSEPPNQVFVLDTTTNSSVAFPIAGATAADFSPDSLKAYIVAGSKLYVYSALDALQTISLGAPATDVTFLADGVLGYMAGGDRISFLPTCNDPARPSLGSVNVPGAALIQRLPDGATILALAPPNIRKITADITGTPTGTLKIGCPMPFGFLTVTHTVGPAFNFGQGDFVPTQLLVSQDGARAYVLTSNLANILVFNIDNQTSSVITLAGTASPIQASLISDGTLLYVVASDGTVHVLDTTAGSDIQQIVFPKNFCVDSTGNPTSFTCSADLLAVRP